MKSRFRKGLVVSVMCYTSFHFLSAESSERCFVHVTGLLRGDLQDVLFHLFFFFVAILTLNAHHYGVSAL